jgi:hypothetical protein
MSLALSATACDDTTNPDDTNEQELITTVELTFTPQAGDPLVFSWADPEGDGDPAVDTVALDDSATYTLTIRFLDELEDPAQDLTSEISDEADQHQVFLTGDAVDGPATSTAGAPLTHSYADTDAAGLPIGLANTVVAATGEGDLTVTLRHLPPQGGAAIKVDGLAQDVADGGFGAIPGDTDTQVTFPVTIP